MLVLPRSLICTVVYLLFVSCFVRVAWPYACSFILVHCLRLPIGFAHCAVLHARLQLMLRALLPQAHMRLCAAMLARFCYGLHGYRLRGSVCLLADPIKRLVSVLR